MSAQQPHHQTVAPEYIYLALPKKFVPKLLTGKDLNDDSCWEECETEYGEEIPDYLPLLMPISSNPDPLNSQRRT